jgi:hypothetical protein
MGRKNNNREKKGRSHNLKDRQYNGQTRIEAVM